MSGKLSAEVARHFVGDPVKLREFYAADEQLIEYNFSVFLHRNSKFRDTKNYKQMQATLDYVSRRCSAFVFPFGVNPDEMKALIDDRSYIHMFDQTKDNRYGVGVRPYGFEVIALTPLPDLARKLSDADLVYSEKGGYDEMCKNLEGGNGHATVFYFDPRQVRILRNTNGKNEYPRWVPVEAPTTPQYKYFM